MRPSLFALSLSLLFPALFSFCVDRRGGRACADARGGASRQAKEVACRDSLANAFGSSAPNEKKKVREKNSFFSHLLKLRDAWCRDDLVFRGPPERPPGPRRGQVDETRRAHLSLGDDQARGFDACRRSEARRGCGDEWRRRRLFRHSGRRRDRPDWRPRRDARGHSPASRR